MFKIVTLLPLPQQLLRALLRGCQMFLANIELADNTEESALDITAADTAPSPEQQY